MARWAPDEWIQPNWHGQEHGECKSTKQHETRCWDRTVFVPDGWEPIDIIRNYRFELPFSLPHAGHMVNKRDVECIASAMVEPSLWWRNMCHFVVAPFELAPGTPDEVNSMGFNLHDYDGEPVLTAGHHRFLAYLLCGLPPSELPPVHVRTAPIGLPYIFPWPVVQWSK
jgi:hypothetical protein